MQHPASHVIEIPLRNRKREIVAVTLIDADHPDACVIPFIPWYMDKTYACRAFQEKGARVKMRLHRVVLSAPPGLEVDHINGDRLDNRRANLRLVTRAQQGQNKGPQPGRASRYRGVTWDRRIHKWMARHRLHGVDHYLGCFSTEDEAAAVASAWRAQHMPFANEDRFAMTPPTPRHGGM